MAEYYHQWRLLGAGFFISCDQADHSDPRLVFSTIAYRLAIFRHSFKQLIAYALDADLDLGRDPITKLVIEPLGKASRVPRPVVEVMVKLLAAEIPMFPVQSRFFITSRPERHITRQFD